MNRVDSIASENAAVSEHAARMRDVSRVYRTAFVETHAMSNITLDIRTGEFLALTGPSGSGKSTLLSVLGLMEPADSGDLQVAGHDVGKLDRNQRAQVRGRYIGFVFQFFHLIPDLTVEDNIGLPMHYAGCKQSEVRVRVGELLERLDIAHRAKHYPIQLSGGQKQRVAIARAMANRPRLILADEPTGNLDSQSGEQVMDLFSELHQEGHTIVLVTHDLRHVHRADRHLALTDGRLAA